MLKATIYRLPDDLRDRPGKAASASVVERAVKAGGWQPYRVGDFRAVPSDSPQRGASFAGGTPIINVYTDMRRGRVLLQYRSQVAPRGGKRHNTPIARRVELIREFADAAGLTVADDSTLPRADRVELPGVIETRAGVCANDQIAGGVRKHGFAEPLDGELQLVVAASKSVLAEAKGLVSALDQQCSQAGAMHKRTTIHKKPLAVEDSLQLLKKPGGSEKRARTVIVYALPEKELEDGDDEFKDFEALGGFDVPVIAARACGANSYAMSGIIYKAWLVRGARPYHVRYDFEVDALVGVDAGHGRDSTSRWSAVRLDAMGRIQDFDSCEGARDESWKDGTALRALERILQRAGDQGLRRLLMHRDGRRHDADWPGVRELAARLGMEIEFVPVAKRGNLTMFREENGQIEAPRFGDALLEEDGSAAWLFTAYGPQASDQNAVRIHGIRNTDMMKALRDTLAAALLPTPGLFMSTRLPATTYWADTLSKRDIGKRLQRGGFMDPPRRNRRAAAPPLEL